MEYNSDFKTDLKLGQLGERMLGRILDNKNLEVKTDYRALKTGNVFVEYSSRDKLSGISITESEWYCFIISNQNIIFIETKKLKELCRKHIGTDRDVVGGDNNSSKGVLLPVNKLIQ